MTHSFPERRSSDLVEERFVLASVAPDYGSLDFTQMTPNEYLTRTAPLERVEHRVCAAVPDERIRELLGLPDGEPVLRMTRRTWSRSEEHTSELQSLMRISYAVFCSPKKRYH